MKRFDLETAAEGGYLGVCWQGHPEWIKAFGRAACSPGTVGWAILGETTAGAAGVGKEVKMPAQNIFKCLQYRSSVPTPVSVGAAPSFSPWVWGCPFPGSGAWAPSILQDSSLPPLPCIFCWASKGSELKPICNVRCVSSLPTAAPLEDVHR